MIHPKATVKRIRTLLIRSGVPKGEVLEEMIDHYLCELESQIDLKNNQDAARNSIYQKIETTDFSHLKKKKKSNFGFLLASVVFVSLSLFTFKNFFVTNEIEIAEQEQEYVQECIEEKAPNGWPINESLGHISSKFGIRIHPIYKSRKLHTGIDIKAQMGTPVLATGTALVKETGFSKKAGHYIILEHNDRFSSKYYHLSSIDVEEFDIVTKGSIIGKVGNTGLSVAPHLHYEIMDREAHIDPLEYISP
ncbi:MAG: M23 family metallopeptidase [Bacteroidota bacterium]